MWRVVAASAVGTSHIANGSECQDHCLAQVKTNPTQPPLLTIFLSDGAGSATFGGTGAQLAIQAASIYAGQHYVHSGFVPSAHWAKKCIQDVRANIFADAVKRDAKARDYACTFLGIVASPFATLVMQIGDGGIVVDIGSGFIVPIAPMSGEYVNLTSFVTD